MSSTRASVALGLVALVTGLLSLIVVLGRDRGSIPDARSAGVVASTTVVAASPEDPWPGVDGSIQRTLVAFGLADFYGSNQLQGVPPEVVRTLSAFGVPLVIPTGLGVNGS